MCCARCVVLFLVVGGLSFAASPSLISRAGAAEHAVAMELPAEYRSWFRNPDGSCVQCSNGMVGMHINRPEWTFLLWDTPNGAAVHGGSWPGRVAEYAQRLGMRIFNVTGDSFAGKNQRFFRGLS
jgi:hypothetical protein